MKSFEILVSHNLQDHLVPIFENILHHMAFFYQYIIIKSTFKLEE